MKDILNSEIIGTGKPFVILHGLFGMLDNWHSIAKKIAEKGYEVHSLDLRNHGESFHKKTMTYDQMSNDVIEYLDSKNIDQTALLGHSMGGKVAMNLALSNPEKISKLMIADIAPKAYTPHHGFIIKALKSVKFDQMKSRKQIDSFLSEYISEVSIRSFLLKSVYRTESGNYKLRFNIDAISECYSHLIEEDFSENLQFEKQTLFLSGEKSGYITTNDNLIIEKYFPNYKVVKIKNAGHWLHAENPKDFLEQVFLYL